MLFNIEGTSVFTVSSSNITNVVGDESPSSGGRSNTTAVFDDMPPSYNDVISATNSSTVTVIYVLRHCIITLS